jgi:SAM-dependent methyltransferase
MVSCRVCGNEEKNVSFTAREMMFGFRDEFAYYQCASCGCLQIKEFPSDLSKYYPQDYYSFSPALESNSSKSLKDRGKQYLKNKIVEQSFGKKNIVGSFFPERYKSPPWAEWLTVAGVGLEDNILDVGCGAGRLILEMSTIGFSKLTGIDRYIEQDIRYENGVRVLKCTLGELESKYDFIMLNHSFEHMEDPLAVLNDIHSRLSENRFALIRIPVAQGYAWENYGINWFQVDAPRHFFLHTEKSMEILAAQAGFKIVKTIYDSEGAQIRVSEGYTRDIPFIEQFKFPYSKEELNQFEERAKVLNKQGKGDQGCFFLQKI